MSAPKPPPTAAPPAAIAPTIAAPAKPPVVTVATAIIPAMRAPMIAAPTAIAAQFMFLSILSSSVPTSFPLSIVTDDWLVTVNWLFIRPLVQTKYTPSGTNTCDIA